MSVALKKWWVSFDVQCILDCRIVHIQVDSYPLLTNLSEGACQKPISIGNLACFRFIHWRSNILCNPEWFHLKKPLQALFPDESNCQKGTILQSNVHQGSMNTQISDSKLFIHWAANFRLFSNCNTANATKSWELEVFYISVHFQEQVHVYRMFHTIGNQVPNPASCLEMASKNEGRERLLQMRRLF